MAYAVNPTTTCTFKIALNVGSATGSRSVGGPVSHDGKFASSLDELLGSDTRGDAAKAEILVTVTEDETTLAQGVFQLGMAQECPDREHAGWRCLEVRLRLPESAALSGTVIDIGNMPVARALVAVLSVPEHESPYVTLASTLTNADGRFEIRRPAAAPYLVIASAAGHAPTAIRMLPGSASVGVPIQLELPHGYSITGKVIGADKYKMSVMARVQSMEGALSVSLPGVRDRGIAFKGDQPFVEWESVACGPNGNWALVGLSAQPYTLESTTSEPGSGSYGVSTGRVTITPPADGLVIKDSWSRIRVKVTCAGEPLPNAIVEMKESGYVRVACRTNKTGETACLVPPDTDWEVRVADERVVPRVMAVHSPSSGEQVSVEVKTTPLSLTSSILLRIRSGSPPVPLSNGRLTIQVFDGNNELLVAKALALQDARGECLVDRLPAGTARVLVEPNGSWNHFRGMLCTESMDIAVREGECTTKELLVRTGGMFRVRANDASGAPVSARIELRDSRLSKIDVSAFLEDDAEPSFYADSPPGNPFLLLPVLEDGTYSLSLTRFSDGNVQTKTLRVTSGAYTEATYLFP